MGLRLMIMRYVLSVIGLFVPIAWMAVINLGWSQEVFELLFNWLLIDMMIVLWVFVIIELLTWRK